MKEITELCPFHNKRKTKLLQFGEGNFLRGFVDEMIDIANETGFMDTEVIMVKPREGKPSEAFIRQNCLYTVMLSDINGSKNRLITCVSEIFSCYEDYDWFMAFADDEDLRFIVSNTTEAGIVYDDSDRFNDRPPKSFPAKLTQFLYRRYKTFSGDSKKGVIILPVELIEDNGRVLKDCVMRLSNDWKLECGFLNWLDEACIFCSTLVDRIISGYPSDKAEELWAELGYRDELIVTGEAFGSWIIESDRDISKEFRLKEAGLPVVFTVDYRPYRVRKVRILNGAHTSFALIADLMGYDTVLEAVRDRAVEVYIDALFEDEIIPTIDMDRQELEGFAGAVLERFKNPHIHHRLYDIALNSVSKWKTRCLPTMLDLIDMGKETDLLIFSLASLLAFYKGKYDEKGRFIGKRELDGQTCSFEIRDDKKVIDIFAKAAGYDVRGYVKSILSNESLWGMRLDRIEGLTDSVTKKVDGIMCDPKGALESVIKNR